MFILDIALLRAMVFRRIFAGRDLYDLNIPVQ